MRFLKLAFAFTAAATCLLVPSTACHRKPDIPRLNVVLVTFDTMRADFLGCYGDPVTRTPAFDALASQGAVFSRAYAVTPFTPPSIWSILYSEVVRGHTYEMAIAPGHGKGGSLAERFRAAGYVTAAVVGTSQLLRGLGYERGFDHYWDTYSQPSFNNETTLARVLELLKKISPEPSSSRPLFLYVHFFDPHTPWGDAPAAFRVYGPEEDRFASISRKRRFFDNNSEMLWAAWRYTGGRDVKTLKRTGEYERLIKPMYRSEVTWSDDVFRRLRNELGQTLGRNTLIAVSSDHGIAFAEHYRTTGYGFSMFDEVLRVPLIMAGPGVPRGRVPRAVSLLDLGPTLLDLAGIDSRHSEGRSFRHLLDRNGRARSVYAQATALNPRQIAEIVGDDRGRYAPGPNNAHAALIRNQYKIIEMPRRRGEKFELFDLQADPRETVDLFSPGNPVYADLVRRLERHREPEGAQSPAPIDPDAAERLRALGYVN
jgi:arylsulfatase A-like enzyme